MLMNKRKECTELCQEYLNKMNEVGIDVILTPGSLIPAPRQGFLAKFPREINATYTPWNLFNFPAGVVPVTKVTEQDEQEMVSKFTSNGRVSRLTSKRMLLASSPKTRD